MSRPFAMLLVGLVLASQAAMARVPNLRLAVPVAWQLTYTRLVVTSAPSMTESFRELWWLEVTPSGLVSLKSPRAKVVAYALNNPGVSGADWRDGGPRRLAVSEADFARLVGIRPLVAYDPEEGDGSGGVTRPIFLFLGRAPRDGVDIDLPGSEEESYSVHFEVGSDGLY